MILVSFFSEDNAIFSNIKVMKIERSAFMGIPGISNVGLRGSVNVSHPQWPSPNSNRYLNVRNRTTPHQDNSRPYRYIRPDKWFYLSVVVLVGNCPQWAVVLEPWMSDSWYECFPLHFNHSLLWTSISPQLRESVKDISKPERDDVILLRFLRGKSWALLQ